MVCISLCVYGMHGVCESVVCVYCKCLCFLTVQDAHSAVPEYDVDSSLFAVYDGHGGNPS